MSEMEKVQQFLKTIHYGEKKEEGLGRPAGCFPFVTISRETGAGGNSVAAAILAVLGKQEGKFYEGWQKFNQELCQKVAQEPGLKVSLDRLLASEYRSEIEDWVEEIVCGTAPQIVVHRKIFELIEALALYGKVVIVGRGGVCLTRHLPLGIHLRLVAPLEKRILKIQELFKWERPKAEDYVRTEDRAREKFMKNYFNQDIHNPHLYDLVWNTGTVGEEEIAQTLVQMIRKRGGGL